MRREGLEPNLGFNVGAGVLFALIFTLIFLMVEQAIHDLRRCLSKATRVDPVVLELLDDPGPSPRIGRDRRFRR